MKNGQLRDFVKLSSGRVGAIVFNDQCGGVFRGHAEVWFGKFDARGIPVLEQVGLLDAERLDVPLSFEREPAAKGGTNG